MPISEKSLELNVGAELLWLIRDVWGYRRVYLRGLTQQEEHDEGPDFEALLDSGARLFAFQFKAPRGNSDSSPYYFKLVRYQHEALFDLSLSEPNSVFYVFPFYTTVGKLRRNIPTLLQDTWFLRVNDMPTHRAFNGFKTRTIECEPGLAHINPTFKITKFVFDVDHKLTIPDGISMEKFKQWYSKFKELQEPDMPRRSPWFARGLRVAIMVPG